MSLIGPLKTRYYHPTSKIQAECHQCPWTFMRWTLTEAREYLLTHLMTTHIAPPEQITLTAEQMPGN